MRAARTILSLLVLASCARTAGPVQIPSDEIPFPLARGQSTIEPPATVDRLLVYFVLDGRLSPVTRTAEPGRTALEASMRALLGGPNEHERSRGLSTSLPAAVRLLDVHVAGETAVVDVSGELQEPADPEAITLRIAQIVWTLTQIAEVMSVRFAVDGEEISVATQDGVAADRPVSRADYERYAPHPHPASGPPSGSAPASPAAG